MQFLRPLYPSSRRTLHTYFRKPKKPTLTILNAENAHQSSPLRLDNLRDNHGARKPEVRIGRGRGSGCGKTSGRGQKGQRARNSVSLGFEGGQTPLHKRLPKRNHFDPFARVLEPIRLGRIQSFIDIGRLPSDREINIHDLVRSGCVRKPKDGVMLMPGGIFDNRINIQVTEVDPEAARQVVAKGGSVTLAWYNKLGLRALIKPEKWTKKGLPLPCWARPPPKMEHRYPDRTEEGLPVRVLQSEEDVEELPGVWKRISHMRKQKMVM